MSEQTPPPPPYGPPPNPSRPKSTARTGLGYAALGALIAAVAIGGGVVFFLSRSNAQEASVTPSVLTPSPTSVLPSSSPASTFLDIDEDGKPDGQECRKEGAPFLRALEEIDSRLSVGMTQSELNAKLGDARVSYDRMSVKALPLNCLGLLSLLEDAFNAYVRSNTKWNNCITNFSCDVDSIDPYLQSQWAIATLKINKAQSSLEKLLRRSN